MNWADTKYLGIWLSNAIDIKNLQVTIVSNGIIQTKVKVIINSVHQWFQIDMIDAGWNLTKVESLRFYCDNTDDLSTIINLIKETSIECYIFDSFNKNINLNNRS